MLQSTILPTCVFHIMIVVFIFTHLFVPFSEVMCSDSDRYRSSDFQKQPFSFMEGGEGIASTEVEDAFSCLFFCLRELKCVSINFARNPDEIGRHLCTIYDSPADYGGFKLVPSELYDFYSIPSGEIVRKYVERVSQHWSRSIPPKKLLSYENKEISNAPW